MKRFAKLGLVAAAVLVGSILAGTRSAEAGGFSLQIGGYGPVGYGAYYGGHSHGGYGGYGGYGGCGGYGGYPYGVSYYRAPVVPYYSSYYLPHHHHHHLPRHCGW